MCPTSMNNQSSPLLREEYMRPETRVVDFLHFESFCSSQESLGEDDQQGWD